MLSILVLQFFHSYLLKVFVSYKPKEDSIINSLNNIYKNIK